MTAPSPDRLPSNRVAIVAEHVLCTGIVQSRNSKDPILPVVAAITVTSHASDAMVAIPFWLEMFAVVAASISGVLVAREHKLDLVGAVALAVVCGLGGGLLRDMTLQVGNVYILNQPMALPLSIATAAVFGVSYKPAGENKPLGAPRGKRPRIRVSCVDQLGACRCHHGHKPGDVFDFDRDRGKMCAMACHVGFPYIDILRYGGTVPGNEPGTAKFCCPEVDTLNVWLAEIVDE